MVGIIMAEATGTMEATEGTTTVATVTVRHRMIKATAAALAMALAIIVAATTEVPMGDPEARRRITTGGDKFVGWTWFLIEIG